MQGNTNFALLAELDQALTASGTVRHMGIVEKIADLFVLGAADYSDDQITLFDDVFTRLVAKIETSACVALSARLARTQSQGHLLAISHRKYLDETITDILVDRGDRPVVLSTAGNLGARFSDFGFSTLVKRAEGDDELTSCVGSRRELPRHHLLRLLSKASTTVRRKLELTDPLGSATIRNAVAEATTRVQARTRRAGRNYALAQSYIDALETAGDLDESVIASFAKDAKIEETIVGFARLCEMPIESVEIAMTGDRPEAILILARAVGMSWQNTKTLLGICRDGLGLSPHVIEQCLATFSRLKPETARQVLAFQRRRGQQWAQSNQRDSNR